MSRDNEALCKKSMQPREGSKPLFFPTQHAQPAWRQYIILMHKCALTLSCPVGLACL